MHEMARSAKKRHDYSQLSEEDLMLLYQKDDEAAIDIIYRRYSGKVYGYLRKKLQTNDAAVDICQNVFIKLHKARDLYHPSVPLAPWLFAIARNALIDWQRTHKLYHDHHSFGVDLTNKSAPKERNESSAEPPSFDPACFDPGHKAHPSLVECFTTRKAAYIRMDSLAKESPNNRDAKPFQAARLRLRSTTVGLGPVWRLLS